MSWHVIFLVIWTSVWRRQNLFILWTQMLFCQPTRGLSNRFLQSFWGQMTLYFDTFCFTCIQIPGTITVFILWTLMSQGSIETCVFLLCFVRFATSTAEEFQGVARWGGSLSAAGILLFPPRVVQSALSTFVGPACHLSAFEGLGDWIRWKLSGDGSQVPSMSLR